MSETNKRYITNLLSATAARVIEERGDSSEDSDDYVDPHREQHAGNMEVVRKTLQGIAARSEDDGATGVGRHATTIRLGRALWETPQLNADQRKYAQEVFFDDGRLPSAKESLKAADEALKNDEERPNPFQGGTDPSAKAYRVDVALLLDAWFKKLQQEAETPNKEQLSILVAARNRIVLEVELDKEHTAAHFGKAMATCKKENEEDEPHTWPSAGIPRHGQKSCHKMAFAYVYRSSGLAAWSSFPLRCFSKSGGLCNGRKYFT